VPKPWAKYEVNFINHDKFRGISGNAILLWIEGKNYADDKRTDGFLPAYEVKLWRFYSPRAVQQLTTSIGPKSSAPGAKAYAPLWEKHPLGYQMHDYLAHNDKSEVVAARIAKAEAKRDADRKRQQEWRAAQERRAADKGHPNGVIERRVTEPVTGDVTTSVTQSCHGEMCDVTQMSGGEPEDSTQNSESRSVRSS